MKQEEEAAIVRTVLLWMTGNKSQKYDEKGKCCRGTYEIFVLLIFCYSWKLMVFCVAMKSKSFCQAKVSHQYCYWRRWRRRRRRIICYCCRCCYFFYAPYSVFFCYYFLCLRRMLNWNARLDKSYNNYYYFCCLFLLTIVF